MRPTGQRERVQVRIGLFFTDVVPRRTPVMVRLGKQDLDIAPGAPNYVVEDSYRMPVDAGVYAIQPHAHYRAREVTASARFPDGSEKPLLHIASWDFDWQDQYRYVSPIHLPAGTTLRIAYRYDNSQANPRNPDFPPRRVRWGQNSSDEMGDVWFQLIAKDDRARATLLADSGRKVLAEDAVGFETLLERDPQNARLHEAAAAIFLSLGQVERGVRHLEQALLIDPKSVEAHYNLATALAWQGRPDEAVSQLELALQTMPTHVASHVNLGALLRARGDMAGATAHLQRALELDPGDAAAHANLGGVLMQQGKVSQAVAQYRYALQGNPVLVDALTELAWTFATSPSSSIADAAEAVRLGEQARSVTNGNDVRALDALAAAYARAGRYRDATDTVDAAMRLVPATARGADDTRRLLRERRGFYAAGRAYEDPGRMDR